MTGKREVAALRAMRARALQVLGKVQTALEINYEDDGSVEDVDNVDAAEAVGRAVIYILTGIR